MSQIEPKIAESAGIKDGVEFVCPFCGRRAAADLTDARIVHEKPLCAEFVDKDVVEYLASVRKHYTGGPS